ncbi:MAG: hypothetical protein AAF352_04555 [Pseudomonadota bacterium]
MTKKPDDIDHTRLANEMISMWQQQFAKIMDEQMQKMGPMGAFMQSAQANMHNPQNIQNAQTAQNAMAQQFAQFFTPPAHQSGVDHAQIIQLQAEIAALRARVSALETKSKKTPPAKTRRGKSKPTSNT